MLSLINRKSTTTKNAAYPAKLGTSIARYVAASSRKPNELTKQESLLIAKLAKDSTEASLAIDLMTLFTEAQNSSSKNPLTHIFLSEGVIPLVNAIRAEDDIHFSKAAFKILTDYQKTLERFEQTKAVPLGTCISVNELKMFTQIIRRTFLSRTLLNPVDKPIIILYVILKETQRKGDKLSSEELSNITKNLLTKIEGKYNSNHSFEEFCKRIDELYSLEVPKLSFEDIHVYHKAITESDHKQFATVIDYTKTLRSPLSQRQINNLTK